MQEHYARARERERSERRQLCAECSEIVLAAVMVLIVAVCRHLVAHRSAAVVFA